MSEKPRDEDRSSRRDKDRDDERRSSKSRRRSRSRSRSKDRKRSRDRRDRSKERREQREKSPVRESKMRADEPEKDRGEHTVFVTQIYPKVDDMTLFEFFSLVGRVEDIKLIKDARTGRSKGMCYVEFAERDSVNKAVALSGQLLAGYPIQVVTVQLDKILKKKEETTSSPDAMRLYVGSLHFNVTEADLRPIFEAFGQIDFIDIHRDPATQQSRGFGFVQYTHSADAKAALASLNGLEIAGRPIKVGVGEQQAAQRSILDRGDQGVERLDDEEGGKAMSAGQRVQLMNKLTRGSAMPGPVVHAQPYMPPAPAVNVPRMQPTSCLVIKNMFDPKETDPRFFQELEEDVREEAGKYGRLNHIYIDRNSQGHVYLRFNDVNSAMATDQSLNGRWFAGRQITTDFLSEQVYLAKARA